MIKKNTISPNNFSQNPDGSHSITVSGLIIVTPDANTWWRLNGALESRFPPNAIEMLFEKKRVSSFKLLVPNFNGKLIEYCGMPTATPPSETASASVLMPNQWTETITRIPDYKDISEESTASFFIRCPVSADFIIGVQITTDYIGDLGITPMNLPFKDEYDKQELRVGAYQVAVEKALNSIAEHKMIKKMNDNLIRMEKINKQNSVNNCKRK